MDEPIDDLLAQGRDEEVKARIRSMLQQPAQTPMPPEVAAGVLEAIVASDRTDNATVVAIRRSGKWWLMAACAAIVILALGAGYIWFNTSDGADVTKPAETLAAKTNDVLPGGNRAILTLADGSVINLDSTNNGSIATQGKTAVYKNAGGELEYRGANTPPATDQSPAFNTVTTPNGGQYQVVLPDGSRVWLNAASSIRFPTTFTGERNVTMTGEAYFEVAHDKKHPFKVSTGDLLIEVLGTHFNIKAYANDAATKTSLLTGSLKVNDQLLKPGQAYAKGKVAETNTDEDVAWKNGLFNLAGADLKDFMHQVERWYDVKVLYEGAVPPMEFQGKLNRAVPLSDIIDYLKNLNVACTLEGKTLHVKSK